MASYISPITKMFASSRTLLTFKAKHVSAPAGLHHQEDAQLANWIPEKVSKLSNKELDHEIHYMGSRLASNDAKIASSRKQLASLKKEHGIVGTIFLYKPRAECAKVRQELEEAKADKKLVLEKAMVLAEEYRKRHWNTRPESTSSTVVSTTGEDESSSSIEKGEHQVAEPAPAENNNVAVSVPAESSVQQEDEKVPTISTVAVDEATLTSESPSEPNAAMNNIIVLSVNMDSRPSIEKKAEPLSPMDAMKQRLASMRTGIAPKDEESLILSQPVGSTGEDSFLGQLHDEEEEAKILAGRRSSTSSSSSCSSPKECISTVTVFEMAMANRSLLDRVSNMQSTRSSSADTANSDVTEEEWM